MLEWFCRIIYFKFNTVTLNIVTLITVSCPKLYFCCRKSNLCINKLMSALIKWWASSSGRFTVNLFNNGLSQNVIRFSWYYLEFYMFNQIQVWKIKPDIKITFHELLVIELGNFFRKNHFNWFKEKLSWNVQTQDCVHKLQPKQFFSSFIWWKYRIKRHEDRWKYPEDINNYNFYVLMAVKRGWDV